MSLPLASGESVRIPDAVFERIEHFWSLVSEMVLGAVSADRESFKHTHDFGRIIGSTICVSTTHEDDIVYAQRLGKSGHTRFVVAREPEPTSEITFLFKEDDRNPGGYVLVAAYYGPRAEPEVWDERATAESWTFWENHALVWGSMPIVNESDTVECPW